MDVLLGNTHCLLVTSVYTGYCLIVLFNWNEHDSSDVIVIPELSLQQRKKNILFWHAKHTSVFETEK